MHRTLKEVMPSEFNTSSFFDTKAYTMKDVMVVEEHDSFVDQNEFIPWPGKQKHVYLWVKLENGYFVGWNENPDNGWSFPAIKDHNEI